MALGSQNQNLNAKKLDINFDADDFFNSFEPVNSAPKSKPLVVASADENTKKDDNKFDASSWTFDNKKEDTSGGGASKTTGTKNASGS